MNDWAYIATCYHFQTSSNFTDTNYRCMVTNLYPELYTIWHKTLVFYQLVAPEQI